MVPGVVWQSGRDPRSLRPMARRPGQDAKTQRRRDADMVSPRVGGNFLQHRHNRPCPSRITQYSICYCLLHPPPTSPQGLALAATPSAPAPTPMLFSYMLTALQGGPYLWSTTVSTRRGLPRSRPTSDRRHSETPQPLTEVACCSMSSFRHTTQFRVVSLLSRLPLFQIAAPRSAHLPRWPTTSLKSVTPLLPSDLTSSLSCSPPLEPTDHPDPIIYSFSFFLVCLPALRLTRNAGSSEPNTITSQ